MRSRSRRRRRSKWQRTGRVSPPRTCRCSARRRSRRRSPCLLRLNSTTTPAPHLAIRARLTPARRWTSARSGASAASTTPPSSGSRWMEPSRALRARKAPRASPWWCRVASRSRRRTVWLAKTSALSPSMSSTTRTAPRLPCTSRRMCRRFWCALKARGC